MTIDGELGTYEVFRRLGVTEMADQAVINRWVAAGAVVPSIARGVGSGSRNLWTEFDCERLGRILAVRQSFHERGLAFPYTLAGEIWEALGRGEPWELAVSVA